MMEKMTIYKEFLCTMTVNEIITELYNNNVVRELIDNITKGTFDNLDDFEQDIYTDLLLHPEKTIKLYEKKELKFYLVGYIRKSVFSHNSPYFQKYQRWNERRSEITKDIKDTLPNDRN